MKIDIEQVKFHGTPVDSLDRSCKYFAECLKCAKSRYGPTCQNPEFRWIKKNQNEVAFLYLKIVMINKIIIIYFQLLLD